MNRRLDIWTRYDRLGASSRLRYFLYADALKAAGVDAHYHPFFDDAYLKHLYAGGGKSLASLFHSWRRRHSELHSVPPETPALIEYELLPFASAAMEEHYLKHRRYFLNFDDAVDLRYAKIPLLKRKYPRLISGAAGVIVANDELLERFGRYNGNLIKIPTVPSPNDDRPEKFPELTVVWIGTPVTWEFVRQRGDALRSMRQVADFTLLVIAAENLPPIPGIRMRCVPWSQEAENSLLPRAHLGIMPLPDTPFARGKSAYKLIQYLCAGIPAIASPVGENRRVLAEGKTGFFADTPEQWAEAFRQLLDETHREAMAPAIAERAKEYSLERQAERLIEFLNV